MVDNWTRLEGLVLVAWLASWQVASCLLSQTRQKDPIQLADMMVCVGFEEQVHNMLVFVFQGGDYIQASGVGTPQMWMQAPHRRLEGPLLVPRSLFEGMSEGHHSLFEGPPEGLHNLFEGLLEGLHSLFEGLLEGLHSQFEGPPTELHSLFEGLPEGLHSLLEGLSGGLHSLDGPADLLQLKHLHHLLEEQGGV